MTRRLLTVMGANLAVAVLSMLIAATFARSLGPTGMGGYQAIIRWTTAGVGLFAFSVGQASAFMSAKHGDSFGSLVRNAIAAALFQSAFLTILGYAFGPLLYAHDADVIDAGRLFLMFVPMAFITDYLGHLARAKLRVGVFNTSRLVQVFSLSVIALFLYGTGRATLQTVILGSLLSYAFGLAVLVSYAMWRGWFSARMDGALLKRTLQYAARIHVGIEARELNLYLDQLMMSAILPLSSLGLYASAVSAAAVLRVGSSAFLYLAQPEVQSVASGARRRIIVRLSRLNFGLMLPAAVGLAISMPIVLPMVYGEVFAPAVPAAQVLCLAVFVEGFGVAMGGVLIGIGRGGVVAFWQLVSLIVSCVALLLWLPEGQILAAAWVSVLSYLVGAIGMTAAVSRAEAIPISEMALPGLAKILSALRAPLRRGNTPR